MNNGFIKKFIVLLLIVGTVNLFSSCVFVETSNPVTEVGVMEVHYIDVGQADSILITSGEANILIDAGNNGDGDDIVSYLKERDIEKLDCVIGTHPHEDHIGGLDNIINAFDIGKIYMPDFPANTKTFEDVLDSLNEKDLKVTTPKAGEIIHFNDIQMQFLTPLSEYSDANNNSIVVRITHGDNTFLFMGDAEKEVEVDILASGYGIESDVLKVGHHGSDTSSSQEFLEVVKPKYAVISVGVDNEYSHPDPETLKKLEKLSVKVYRTDLDGTVVIVSDGESLESDKK